MKPNHIDYSSYFTVKDGEMSLTASGQRLFDYFQNMFRSLALEYGATIIEVQDVLPEKLVAKYEVDRSFPHLLVKAENKNAFYSSAVCYHLYDTQELKAGKNNVFFASGKVKRNEAAYSLSRLHTFTMSEIVFFGDLQEVFKLRDGLLQKTKVILSGMGINVEKEHAIDPFYENIENKNKILSQKMSPAKFELVTEDGLAITSGNVHFSFFTDKENLPFPASGCVAFGVERWILAFLQTHGTNESSWPIHTV